MFPRRRFILCAFCVILATLILGASTTRKGGGGGAQAQSQSHSSILNKGLKLGTVFTSAMVSPCKDTLYPSACESAVASIDGAHLKKTTEKVFDASLKMAVAGAHSARSMAYNFTVYHQKLAFGRPTAMDDCFELMDITLDLLNDVTNSNKKASSNDIQTWLSAAITNQVTCQESLATHGAGLASKDTMNDRAQSLMEHVSNSLALYKSVKGKKKSSTAGAGRKLLADGYPSWLSAADRRLLKASPEDIKADAVVAQDGTGTHTTINEALAFLFQKYSTASSGGGGGGRSVMYLKAGTYKGPIVIPTKQKNVMIMGDGKGKTVIIGSKSAGSGSSTYQSATVAAMGAGFIGKGLTIINNAGPEDHQAVALRVGADKSVITQCSIQAYQDTLYTHSNRQFYRDNDITGTVDFIFGNSAAVFQNCFIQPRRAGSGQKNSVTAQGRSDPNQNTGISIQSCTIKCSSDIDGTPTYLGRPWHKYARVVVMESFLDGCINKDGWEPWSGSFAESTAYYAEYDNSGPGARPSDRVHWGGVHPSISSSEASKFTVSEFIVGDYWLPGTGVDYKAGL
ncbi:pectinesterase-like [Dioscorea cayenensis subsp. rotundata]|uniref:Pectinesterase n=1 Tax=Dioscorea cayennensis subsp. rotundata TaxID=55577 RepID=A0AB40D1B4_DIOCR|nr:pectinesterase-like [Dioscorea cayenensis subsp. rotundata]